MFPPDGIPTSGTEAENTEAEKTMKVPQPPSFNFDTDVKKSIEDTLKTLGYNVAEAQSSIRMFMVGAAGYIADAVAAGDELSLKLLRDQLAGRLARVALQSLYKERQAILEAVMKVIMAGLK